MSKRKIVLDGSVLGQIKRGNAPVAEVLRKLLDSGHEVFIATMAYTEQHTPADMRLIMDSGIKPPPPVTRANYEAAKEQVKRTRTPVNAKDVPIAVDALAIDAELFTMDFGFRTTYGAVGGKVVPEANNLRGLDNPQPPADHELARHLLRLPYVRISPDGKILPKATSTVPSGPRPKVVSGGGGGGDKGSGGTNGPASPPTSGGGPAAPATGGGNTRGGGGGGSTGPARPGPVRRVLRGLRRTSSAHEAAAEGFWRSVNSIMQGLIDDYQAQRMQEQWDRKMAAVETKLAGDPSLGALIVVTYYRREKTAQERDTPMEHPNVFGSIEIAYGYNESEARLALASKPAAYTEAKAGEPLAEIYFIPPTQPVDFTKLRTPFPKIGLATFVPGREKLQGVKWLGRAGFDDMKEMKLDVPADLDLNFLCLEPPEKIAWFDGSIRYDTEIDRSLVHPAQLAQGMPYLYNVGLPVVDLDTASMNGFLYVVGIGVGGAPMAARSMYLTKAAMVFPADTYTESVFQRTPPTQHKGKLHFPNFDLVRWVRPENMRLLRDLRIRG